MSKSTYSTALSNKTTPQSAPIPGREKDMAKNNAGGFTFTITPFQMLERFLILGSDKPTYYSSAQKLTKNNAENIRTCLKEDGRRTVDLIVAISEQGRAPKNDPALFALAVAASPSFGSQETAQYALANLNKVARTGTHLMHFTDYLDSMRGWGRSVKRAVGEWYTSKTPDQLAYSLAKYQSRDGWSTKDLVSLAHVRTTDDVKASLMAWGVMGGLDGLKTAAEDWNRTPKKYDLTSDEVASRRARYQRAYDLLSSGDAPKVIAAYEAAKKAKTAKEIARIIREGGLSHEMIPTQFKTEAIVWEALLEKMPIMALVRNLGNMSKVGLLTPLSAASKLVVARLTDKELVKKSKIHPLQIMLAKGTYGQGRGRLGSGTWNVVAPVVDALEEAFYSAFANVVPTGKNVYIGLDISGSMGSEFSPGSGVSCAQAGAALSLVVAKTEKNYAIYGFASGRSGSGYGGRWGGGSSYMADLKITAKDTLESAQKKAAAFTMGGTDCSLPMIHAKEQGLDADAFVVITDNETWAGNIQPSQALKQYRSARNKADARLIVMAMTPTQFSIADPTDPYSLDIVGFDSNVPALVSDFIRGSGAGASEDTE
jgi:60 kDa SS-A/Ro ribonucleoprotein